MMRKVLKFGVTLVLISALSNTSNGQFKASAGLELGFALEDGFGLMYGASVGGEYGISDKMGVTAQLGFILNTIDDDLLKDASSSFIPVQLGYKYYFDSNESGFYAHAQLGVHMYRFSYEFESFTFNPITFQLTPTTQEVSINETYFSYAIGGGFLVNEHIDLGLRFNIISADGGNFNYIGSRVAYNF